MLSRRGPYMPRGDARRRAAGALAWTPPRLRTYAMNLLGRAPHAHAALGLVACSSGGVPPRVPCTAPQGAWPVSRHAMVVWRGALL
jgi:hypothetical protein